MQTAWQNYVSEYNSTYKGMEMQNEYNQAVQSGNLVKNQKNK